MNTTRIFDPGARIQPDAGTVGQGDFDALAVGNVHRSQPIGNSFVRALVGDVPARKDEQQHGGRTHGKDPHLAPRNDYSARPERSGPRIVSVQLHPLEYEADDIQFLLVGNRIGFQPLRDLQVLLRRGIAFKIPV